MTLSSASVSACEVDDVAATAARGGGGLRDGGKAACWRVAGARAAAPGAAIATGAVFLAAVAEVFLADVAGTTLRAIGRGFGSGTFGLAQASAATTDNPTDSSRLAANAVGRNTAAREDGVTAFPDGESFNR